MKRATMTTTNTNRHRGLCLLLCGSLFLSGCPANPQVDRTVPEPPGFADPEEPRTKANPSKPAETSKNAIGDLQDLLEEFRRDEAAKTAVGEDNGQAEPSTVGTTDGGETQDEPEIDVWAMFLERFYEKTEMQYEDLRAELGKSKPLELPEHASLPKDDAVAGMRDPLLEIQKEHRETPTLSSKQKTALEEALAAVDAVGRALAVAREAQEELVSFANDQQTHTRTLSDRIDEELKPLRSGTWTESKFAAWTANAFAPESLFSRLVPTLTALEQQGRDKADTFVEKANTLESERIAAEEAIIRLKQLMPNDPRVEQARRSTSKLGEAIKVAVSSTMTIVGALVFGPAGVIAAFVLIALLSLFGGRSGGKGSGKGSEDGPGETDEPGPQGDDDTDEDGQGQGRAPGEAEEEDPFETPGDPVSVTTPEDGPHRIQVYEVGSKRFIRLFWNRGEVDPHFVFPADFGTYGTDGFRDIENALRSGELKIDSVASTGDWPFDFNLSAGEDTWSIRYAAQNELPRMLSGTALPDTVDVEETEEPVPVVVPSGDGPVRLVLTRNEDAFTLRVWRRDEPETVAGLDIVYGLESDQKFFRDAVEDRTLQIDSVSLTDDDDLLPITMQLSDGTRTQTVTFSLEGDPLGKTPVLTVR